MISYTEALQTIKDSAGIGEVERVSLDSAAFRICARDILSPEYSPAFANSAMDGFALRSTDSETASDKRGLKLRVLGTISAGDSLPKIDAPDESGTAWEIMTGAPIPDGFDAVIKVEEVRSAKTVGGGREVEISRVVPRGENCRAPGEDFRRGDMVMSQGMVITPERLLALAGLGIAELDVFRKPRAGVLATGDELVESAEGSLEVGMVRNSSKSFLVARLEMLGLEPHFYGTVADDQRRLVTMFERMLEDRVDLVVTTGAVSAGKFDLIIPAIRQLGADIIFHKVAIRPGRPILCARMRPNGCMLFGLPGNPVSSVVGTRFFIEPYVRALQTRGPETQPWAKLKSSTTKPKGLTAFYKARITTTEDSELYVETLPGQASFMVSPFLTANAWAILPEGVAELSAGTKIQVAPMHAPLI